MANIANPLKRGAESLAQKRIGRPPGAKGHVSSMVRLLAAESGLLPHELLLAWARGEPMVHKTKVGKVVTEEEIYIDPLTRIDCAKAAAAYYAPRLAATQVDVSGSIGVQELSDGELDAKLSRLLESQALLAMVSDVTDVEPSTDGMSWLVMDEDVTP
jgi:hypothetical protein